MFVHGKIFNPTECNALSYRTHYDENEVMSIGSLVLPSIIRQDWEGLPRRKALAYLASSSVTKKKGFNIDSKGQFYKEISQ
jgi:hypothetical protein